MNAIIKTEPEFVEEIPSHLNPRVVLTRLIAAELAQCDQYTELKVEVAHCSCRNHAGPPDYRTGVAVRYDRF